MIIYLSFLLSFLLGGILGAPLILFYGYKLLNSYLDNETKLHLNMEEEAQETKEDELDINLVSKVGWIEINQQEKLILNQSNISGLLSSSLSTLLDRKATNLMPKRNKDACYAVLKYDKLMIYDSGNRTECRGIIVLTEYEVQIYPTNLPDNEIFKKTYPIYLKFLHNNNNNEINKLLGKDYYIYLDTPVEKEAWFIALLKASVINRTKKELDPLNFDKKAMDLLKYNLDLTPDASSTKWLNAVLGRIFLGIYKTEAVKQYFVNKINTKTTKVKKPGFLGDIHVREIVVGDSIPFITNPKLLSLSKEGELSMEMDLSYKGGFKAEIETEASLQVTTRLKPLKIHLLLAVVLKSLSGKILLRFKSPPTNRFWIGFYELPKIELNIEPMVSDTQIKSTMILQAIEKRIMEVIKEALVLPNMDDYCFFPSNGTGGIFDILENDNDSDNDNNDNKNENNGDNEKDKEEIAENKNKLNEEIQTILVEEPKQANNESIKENENINNNNTPTLKNKLQNVMNQHSHLFNTNSNSNSNSNSNPTTTTSTPTNSVFSEKLKSFRDSYFSKKSTKSIPPPPSPTINTSGSNSNIHHPIASTSMPDLLKTLPIQRSNSLNLNNNDNNNNNELQQKSVEIICPPPIAVVESEEKENSNIRKRIPLSGDTLKVKKSIGSSSDLYS